jgi:xanthine dehydrogenase YagT iron-sulfur-binding subunit
VAPCDLLDEDVELVEPGAEGHEELAEGHDELEEDGFALSRRRFLQATGAVAAVAAVGLPGVASGEDANAVAASQPVMLPIEISINGQMHSVTVDTRTSLLDLLREGLDMTGSKKGCDHGQCGACTVLLDGRRVNSCLTLAVAAAGQKVTTIEGLGTPEALGPVQTAFLEHDAFQCGYCTPGQICSATALMEEAKRGELSLVSFEERMTGRAPVMNDREIKERMSGNICRCGAYPNIVAAVRQLTGGTA